MYVCLLRHNGLRLRWARTTTTTTAHKVLRCVLMSFAMSFGARIDVYLREGARARSYVCVLYLKLVIRFYSFIFPLKLSPMQCQSNIKWNWMAFQFARAFHTKNVKFVLQHIHDDSQSVVYRSHRNFPYFCLTFCSFRFAFGSRANFVRLFRFSF